MSIRKNAEKTENKKVRKKKKWTAFGKVAFAFVNVFFFIAVLLLVSEIWLFNTWESLSIDEIMYHLSTTLEGTNPDMIWQYIFGYGIWAVVIAVIFVVGLFVLRDKKRKIYKVTSVGIMLLSAGMLLFVAFDMNAKLQLFDYVAQQFGADSKIDYIGDHYVDPNKVALKFPEKKRNLIYIYLESMEMSYADKSVGGAFDENYIPELTELALENECFNGHGKKLNGGLSLPGTTWTMGALFGQSTSLPLKISIGANRMNTQEDFFRNVTGLGDILSAQGYNQTFMIGSDAVFGGRDLYYKQHGNFNIRDYVWAKEQGKIPQDYHVFWGFEDEKLYSFAKQELKKQAKKSQPFNFTMLTVDTHFEDGYVCRLCGKEHGDNQYANVMRCASRQVIDFLNWIKKQDFYENTTIILNGDHPTMDKDFFQDITGYQRKTYTVIINGAAQPTKPSKKREYCTIDMFPTTLAAMGVEIPGGKLGMGVNLYDSKVKTIVENEGFEAAKRGMNGASKFMNEMAGVSINQEVMDRIDEKAKIAPRLAKRGTINFRVKSLFSVINYKNIDKIVLKVRKKNKKTGKTTQMEYKASIEPQKNNPTRYDVLCRTNIPFSKEAFKGMTVEAYCWIGDFKEYKFGRFVYDNDSLYAIKKLDEGLAPEEIDCSLKTPDEMYEIRQQYPMYVDEEQKLKDLQLRR